MRSKLTNYIVAGLCAATFSVTADEGDDEVATLQLRLKAEEQLLVESVADARQSIQLAERLEKHVAELRRLEDAIIRAEDRSDEDRMEELEQQIERVEEARHKAEVTLDLLGERRELSRFLIRLAGEGQDELLEEGRRLLEVQAERIKLVSRDGWFDEDLDEDEEFDDDNLHDDDPRDDEDERDEEERGEDDERDFDEHDEDRTGEEGFEGEWGRFSLKFRLGYELLELRTELSWAYEEDDEDFIGELEREIRNLKRRVDRLSNLLEPEVNNHAGRVQPIKISSAEVDAAADLDFEHSIFPLLKSSCFSCHDADSASGDFNLAALAAVRPLVVNRLHWINATQQLKLRSMPPQDANQPTDEDRRKLIAWLTHAIERFDYTTVHSPGFEPTRRLTHEEYNNTIRDLFGVDVRPANRFPLDFTATSGFDNSANSLFLQPVLMERYFHATEELLDELLPISQSKTRPRRATETSSAWRNVLQGRAPRDALVPFLTRVFRRPLSREQSRKWLTRFDSLQSQSNSAEDAFRKVVGVALVSPEFLLLSEEKNSTERDRADATRPYRVSQHDLASRLSYFLWASTPDAELMSLADTGRLSDQSVLRKQVERLLNDRRSETLGRLFLGQWLGVSKLDRLRPDQIDNPWATDALIDSMKAESALFFNSLVQEDAPIERLVDADYTYVNEDLAGHYIIDHIRGPEMRRVKTDGFGRGGILGHASILAITSFPGRTSPVLRGNWILTDLLGTPPPPPPPNVSQFDEELEELEDLSPRARLEAHRNNPNCYVCHNEIDPLGFALDQYEWFGRHRPRRDGRRVDARGQLPDGTVVVGLDGLKSVIATTRRDDLVQQISRKMLSYALGRQLEYYDEATVQQIIQQVEADDRQIRSLVHAVVSSDAFQMKESPQAATEGLTNVR